MEHGLRAHIAVELPREPAQTVGADQLCCGQTGPQDRERSEPPLDRRQVLGVQLLPRLEPGIGDLLGQEAIHHDGVHAVPEKPEIGRRASRFGDDDGLGVHDDADACPGPVGEQAPHPVETVVEVAGCREHVIPGHGHRGQAREDGPDDLGDGALDREDPVHVPGQDVGQRQQADRLRRRRAVDHEQVPRPLVRVLLDLGQGEELVQTGQDRQLLGLDVVETPPAQELDQISLDGSPGVLETLRRVHLLSPQPVHHPGRVRPERTVEGVGQGVGGVGGHHDGAQTGVGTAERRGRGHGRLAHASLAREEQCPHAPDSTRSLRFRSAVPMIRPSALRLTKPGMGTRSSATRW